MTQCTEGDVIGTVKSCHTTTVIKSGHTVHICFPVYFILISNNGCGSTIIFLYAAITYLCLLRVGILSTAVTMYNFSIH